MEYYEMHAPKAKGVKSLLRRIRQLGMILSDNTFKSEAGAQKTIIKRYNSEVETKYYQAVTKVGVEHEELEAVERLLENNIGRRALVVGTGTGREAFGLEDLGFKVVAIDYAEQMIKVANQLKEEKKSKVEFYTQDFVEFSPDQKFDLIFVSAGITGHIRHQSNRVKFYQKAHQLLSEEGRLITLPDVNQFSLLSIYNIASQILRIKNPQAWELGDTARSFLGKHNNESELFFFHFYQSQAEVVDELGKSGFEVDFKIADAYVMKKK